ncbi:MAG: ComF family protein [Pseudomonadota bacterium]
MFGSSPLIVNRWSRLRLTGARQFARLMAATLFPPRCCLCRFEGASLDLDLCGYCRADLPWNGLRSAGELFAFRFEYPVDDLIRRLKYQGALANARVLGVLLAQAACECDAPLPRLLVPVPLHIARLRERGFNQAAALARYAGRMLEIPCANRAVRRTRNTPSQTSLDRAERHRNVREAFAVGGRRALRRLLEAGHVAIVDDVVTTGSTMSELRRILLAAGVRQVDVWAVARAL